MQAHIRYVHRRDRMVRHCGMAVQTKGLVADRSEEVTERLKSFHLGRRHNQRVPRATHDWGSLASIHFGPCERAIPAIPMERHPGKRASCSDLGTSRKSTVGRPAKVRTSITA